METKTNEEQSADFVARTPLTKKWKFLENGFLCLQDETGSIGTFSPVRNLPTRRKEVLRAMVQHAEVSAEYVHTLVQILEAGKIPSNAAEIIAKARWLLTQVDKS